MEGKPKSITQLTKEQLEDLCLNLMKTDSIKTKYVRAWEDLKDLHLKTKKELSKEVINELDIIVFNEMKQLEEEHNIIDNKDNKSLAIDVLQQQLQQELFKANDKLKKIDTFIRGHQLFGMRFAKTLYRECLEYILKIIKGDD